MRGSLGEQYLKIVGDDPQRRDAEQECRCPLGVLNLAQRPKGRRPVVGPPVTHEALMFSLIGTISSIGHEPHEPAASPI